MRNWLLYGEPTGTQMMVLIAGAREHTATAIELIGEWDGFFKAYWGLFGAVNIPMNDRIYVALEIFVALGIVGLAAQLYLFIQQRNRSLSFGEVPVSLAISMCATLFALSFIAFLRWTSQTFASQGRLLFPVITIVSVFLASGHTTLTSLLTRRLLARGAIPSGIFLTLATYAIPICLAMLTALAPILNIVPAYALPNRGAVAGEGCPMEQGGGAACFAPATRTEIRFGDSIRWIGFSTQPRYPRLSQPDVLDITLYWQALKPIRQNLSLFIKLYDSANNEVFAMDGTPGGGMLQTTEWQPGWVIADHYQLRVQQPIQTPTALRMDAGFYEFSTRQNLATFDSRGNPTGRQRFEVAGVGVPANPGITSLARTSGIFTANANHPRAISVALESPTRHGNNLTVPLTWLTVAPIDGDFTVFAQLFDDQNLKIGQADGRPVDNTFGTQWWPPGLPVSEVREFSIGSPPPGHYTLHYGLYDAAQPSLPRLAAFTPTGTPAPDNILVYEFDLR